MALPPPVVVEPEPEVNKESDPIADMKKSEEEAASKYGLKKKLSSVAQRKISTGGVQYFDSGDYHAQKSQKDKRQIASNPSPYVNPMLARARGIGGGKPPSKLAAGRPSQLAKVD